MVSAIRDITERQRRAETLRRTEHLALLGKLAAHGGAITVQSEVGPGTTITLTLPLAPTATLLS